MRRAGGIVSMTAIAVAIALATLVGQGRQGSGGAATAKPYTTWQSYAGGAHSSQYSALDQINKSNVAKLQVAWSVPITGNSIFNPVVVDGVMYAPVGGGDARRDRRGDRQGDLDEGRGRAPGARGHELLGELRIDRTAGSSSCSAAASPPSTRRTAS